MSINDAAPVRRNEPDELSGQPMFRVGYYCFAAVFVLFVAAGTGTTMFDDKALNFAIALFSAMSGLCFAASIRGGNKLGTELTWCLVGLNALNAAAFLIVPLVRA